MNEIVDIKVIFRKFKDDGSIIALFPDEVYASRSSCMSYMHVGQHGDAHYDHCINTSVAATETEYAPLVNELERLGYKLNIRKRR